MDEFCAHNGPHCSDDLIYGPDPYNEEIHGDTTPVTLCSYHYLAFKDDI